MGGRKFTEDEIKQAKELYLNNYNTVQIAEILNRSQTGIERLLKREGVMKSGTRRALTLKSHEIQDIVKRYTVEMESTISIGKSYGLCDRTIVKILKEEGIEIRPTGHISQIKNINYFESIETDEQAYFLGLMISDGNVQNKGRNKWVSGIELDIKDKYIIDRFAECVGAPSEYVKVTTRYYSGRKSGEYRDHAYLRIHGEKMAKDLSQYGVVPNKTTQTFLPILDQKVMPGLIRGLFDGDGSVYVDSKTDTLRITQYGSHRLCEEMAKYLHEHVGMTRKKPYKKTETLSMLQYGRQSDIEKFFHYIYKDATIYMKRKKDKFLSRLSIC